MGRAPLFVWTPGMLLKQTWARAAALAGAWGAGRERSADARNIRLLNWDIIWFGLLFGVWGNFLTVFVTRLNPSPWLVSAVTSGPALVNIIWQLPAVRIVERRGNPKQLVVQSAIPHRLGFLLIGLIPWLLPVAWQAYGVVAIVLLQGLPAAVMVVAFSTLFTGLVPRDRMAGVVGLRNALMGITSTLTVVLCGIVLTRLAFPLSYQVLFVGGFLASLGSLWCVTQLQTGQQEVERGGRAMPPALPVAYLWRDRNYVRFVAVAWLLNLGMFMTAPLFPLYWVGRLGLGDGWISVFATTLGLAGIVGAFVPRMLGDRFKIPTMLGLSSLLFALYPLLTSLLQQPILLAAVAGFAGIWGASINVVLFNALAEVCPPEHRPRYMGVYTWLANIAIFAGPIAAAGLADVLGVETALLVAAGVRALAGILFLRFPFQAWDEQHQPGS